MSNKKDFRPTLAQLRNFVTLAEHKHFGTAATKLNISQPSLSQALTTLETGLGVNLIERSTRKVIITPEGMHLLPYAHAVLDALETFTSAARGSTETPSGPLNIGIIPTVAPYILPHLLGILSSEFPDLEPRIVEEQTAVLMDKLREGILDVALLALPAASRGFTELPLYTESFHVVTHESHPLAGRQDLSLDDLESLNLLLLDEGHCLRDQILDLCRIAMVNPHDATQAITRAASLTTIMQLVIGGLGSTLIPTSALKAECHDPRVTVANFAPSVSAQRTIGLIFRATSQRVQHFEQLGGAVKQAFNLAAQGCGTYTQSPAS